MAKAIQQFQFRGVCYQLKPVHCKKPTCTKCPHGPYWYALITIGRGRAATRYIGKQLTGDAAQYYQDNYYAIARGDK